MPRAAHCRRLWRRSGAPASGEPGGVSIVLRVRFAFAIDEHASAFHLGTETAAPRETHHAVRAGADIGLADMGHPGRPRPWVVVAAVRPSIRVLPGPATIVRPQAR